MSDDASMSSTEKLHELEVIFDQHDSNSDEYLTIIELMECLVCLSYTSSYEEVQAKLASMSQQGPKSIDFTTFIHLIASLDTNAEHSMSQKIRKAKAMRMIPYNPNQISAEPYTFFDTDDLVLFVTAQSATTESTAFSPKMRQEAILNPINVTPKPHAKTAPPRRHLDLLSNERRWFDMPFITITVCFVMVATFLINVIIGNGIQNFDDNPFLGVSAVSLAQSGAKFVPCMRIDGSIDKFDSNVQCTAQNTPFNECTAYDNLNFICGLSGFQVYTKPDQWYRIITATIIHAGMIHILINIPMLLWLGSIVEKKTGHLKFLVFFVIIGSFSTVVGSLFESQRVDTTSSAIVCGLFGILCCDILFNGTKYKLSYRILATGLFLLTLFLGLFPFIDFVANFCGFVSGFLIAPVFILKMEKRVFGFPMNFAAKISLACLFIAVFAGFSIWFYAGKAPNDWPFFDNVDCLILCGSTNIMYR